MTEKEIAECAEYTAFYRNHSNLICKGDYYRLSQPDAENSFTHGSLFPGIARKA